MTYTELMLDVHDKVATLTFNRPAAMNALGGALRDEFADAVAELSGRAGADISAIVLTGAGRAFCAGGDLRVLQEMSAKGPEAMRARMQESHFTLNSWLDLPVPTIAAVNGAAAGAGFSLAIASDLVFATNTARFIMSFGRIGLVPDWGAMYILPRLVGLQRAKELVLTARDIGAEEARDLGLVLEIVDVDRLLDHAQEFAAKFANASPIAVGIAKRVMGSAFETDRATALAAETDAQVEANASDYHRAAVRRFLAKEPPLFNWD
ncbi:MAG: enoyl-CoA hydratase [Alphaproteobacteria bacterium]|nr:enoyl-CoA hydratase [Alphaproteobacteria bacterium]HCP00202.1 enoyl-CoA hydratase/isomerase family protein [Rhodospirillaceae bacterium]